MTTEIGGPCLLRDGSMVEIRQVACGDAPLLADGFARLSVRSRRSRFMRDKNRLTEAELRFLTCIDHHDHEALGALGPDGRGVGVARYIRDTEEPRAAELAITVVDDWQGRGVGSALLMLLADRARDEGIKRFSAVVLATNREIIEVLEGLGQFRVDSREGGTLETEFELPPAGLGEGLRGALRLSAAQPAGAAASWPPRMR